MTSCKINEIFLSLQGEGTRTGLPCILVRLTGCNLTCTWCDTAYARDEGTDTPLNEILVRIGELKCKRVELTGGEPLLQPGALELLERLCDDGYETLVETNGSVDISSVDRRVVRIVDFKCPSSGQTDQIYWANVNALQPSDEVKFVIGDRGDYDFACQTIEEHCLLDKCHVILSPVAAAITPAELAAWILADGLDVRMGLQLHKIIWPDKDRGV